MPNGDQTRHAPPITRSSAVSISLLTGILAVTATVAWGGSRWATRVDARLERIEEKLEDPCKGFAVWADTFRTLNPGLKVPNVLRDG